MSLSTSDTEVIQMSKLNNEDLLISYVSSGFNQTKTAKTLGTTKQTVNRRVQSPEFQELLQNYRKNLFQKSSQILLENSVKASRTLAKLLDSSSENVKLQSACKILNLSNDFTTIADLETELENLKSTIEGFNK